jgi:hypothetical protein
MSRGVYSIRPIFLDMSIDIGSIRVMGTFIYIDSITDMSIEVYVASIIRLDRCVERITCMDTGIKIVGL